MSHQQRLAHLMCVTSVSHQRYIHVTSAAPRSPSALDNSHISVTSVSHQRYISATSALHQRYISVTSVLH
eukprot:8891292-Pyramimonas_sp.AAC.1